MNAYEAVGLGRVAVRDPWEKLVMRNSFGFWVFAAINLNSLVTPDSSEGTQYIQVKSPGGVLLCAAKEQDPNNLNGRNVLRADPGDWISYVDRVLGVVSNEYFNLKYPGYAAAAANTTQSYVPVNSNSLNGETSNSY
tara:strand:+ start:528 stop:938 length:411 start_codon:yes stop_codon:yes gene_type:complete